MPGCQMNALINALTCRGINRNFFKINPTKNFNNGIQSSRPLRGNSLHRNTSYDVTQCVFAQHSSPFYPTPNILYLTMLFNQPDTPKVPVLVWGIDREFEFYEFFSFLKFNEF